MIHEITRIDTNQEHFALGPTALMNLGLGSFRTGMQEIKVASQVRLRNMGSVQCAESTFIPGWRRFPLLAPARHFVCFHQQIEFPLCDAEFDQITIPHKLERSTNERLR